MVSQRYRRKCARISARGRTSLGIRICPVVACDAIQARLPVVVQDAASTGTRQLSRRFVWAIRRSGLLFFKLFDDSEAAQLAPEPTADKESGGRKKLLLLLLLRLPLPLHLHLHLLLHLPHCKTTVAAAGATPNLNFPTRNPNSISTTESSSFSRGLLSPRALEKQPVRDAYPPRIASLPAAAAAAPSDPSPLFLTLPSADLPPVTSHPPSDLTPSDPQPQTQRRSFLEALLIRQKKVVPPDNRSATSRVLNPINYVPRPTPVRVQPPSRHQREISADTSSGEVYTLLTLPQQRRSRQHSPTDPIVEHSPHLPPTAGDRTSIGLPNNQQRSKISETTRGVGQMIDPEKQETNGVKEPERAHVPTSKYSTRQPESQQSPAVLGQSYGINPLDQPLQPPRRITSRLSLRRAQSAASIHSSAFGRTNSEVVQVPGSQEDVGQGYPGGDDASVGEELAWGPSHPCFPHLNPHVPVNSPEYSATRVIRVRRDWMIVGDLAPAFSNIYPEILDPLMPEPEFRYVIEHINQTLVRAYNPFSAWNWFDGLMGLLTGWFWEDFRPMGIKGQLRALEQWLEDWNHTVGARDGVKIIPLRRTGYMNLDIQIPDPQVRVVGDDDESQQPPPTAASPEQANGHERPPP